MTLACTTEGSGELSGAQSDDADGYNLQILVDGRIATANSRHPFCFARYLASAK